VIPITTTDDAMNLGDTAILVWENGGPIDLAIGPPPEPEDAEKE